MATNKKRKEQKKETILNAATKVFISNGYKKTSVAEIAKEADSSQVTLYKYFPSKIELAREVMIKMIIDGYAGYDEQLEKSNLSFKEKVEEILNFGSNEVEHVNPDFMGFMIDEFQGSNGDDRVMKAYDKGKEGFWGKILKQGRAEGDINDNIQDEVVMMYVDMILSYFMNPATSKKTKDLVTKKYSNGLAHVFFYGIMGR
ncbi:TetR/AcrR family transcriptional regulator [Companilactobacillus baiquanensis]|uniref:TetR/AcrR family transcriptional regulator n=1 Tax=Companilactobacillus baiquanensis TaxID=2486005 RepID=A0ABW1UW02_9LACO|nr:TetR/AcrR family transcriptional regulator [Companilactobacillus baiquanensis]